MQCLKCGYEISITAIYCTRCGAQIQVKCVECSANSPIGASFCSRCGSKLPDDIQSDLDTPQAITSSDQLTTQPDLYERRIVTILFADIVSSTSFAENIDPENVLDIMSDAYPCLLEPIEEFGGSIIQVLGDGVYAHFGVPRSMEDDPERAILAGLDIITRIQIYAKKLQKEQILDSFHVRVGINTGLVVVGEMSPKQAAKHLALGDSVNLAARLETSAPLDSVLISHTTYQHVRGLFEVQPQSPISVKGRQQVEQTYLIVNQKPIHLRSPDRGLEGVITPMIGRDHELDALKNKYQASVNKGETQLVLMHGDAGIGKTRLAIEFLEWVTSQRISPAIFHGRATPSTQNMPFGVLRNLFARSFEILESDTSTQALDKFRQGTKNFLDTDQADLIGQLVGFDFKASPTVKNLIGNPSFSDIALLYLQTYIQKLAEKPLLLFIEDLHWIDERTLELISDLVCDLGSDDKNKLMVLCTSRPQFFEKRPNWGDKIKELTRFELTELSNAQRRSLVDELLCGMQDIPEAFYQRILDETGGNPFFIEEMIKMLMDQGVIECDDKSQIIRMDKFSKLKIPTTLSGILQARLDSLPNVEKLVLQRAAIIGRVFWDGLLRELTMNKDEGERINTRLAALRKRGLIIQHKHSSIADSQEYMFKHALLCSEAYESVLLKHRQNFHYRVASWIEENAGDRLEEHLQLIATHYLEGGQPKLAVKWLIQAGERALIQCSIQEAKALFEQALKLVDEGDLVQVWRATLGHDEAVGTLGEVENRHADDITLLNLAKKAGKENWLTEAYFRIGSQAKSEGDNPAALHAFNQALESAKRIGDLSMEALILPMQVTILIAEGNLSDADKLIDRSLKLANEIGDADILARALTNIAPYYQAIGDMSRSVQLMHKQIDINQKQGNLLGEAYGLINLGYFYLSLGHIQTGHDLLEKALQISHRLGARSCIAYSQLNLGMAEWRLGQTNSACQTLDASLEVLESLGDQGGLAARLFYLGLVYESSNDLVEASNFFSDALAGYKLINATPQIVEVQAGLARVALQTGDIAQAEKYALQIIHYLDQEGPQGLELPILGFLTCTRIFSALDDTDLLLHTVEFGRKEIDDRLEKISDEQWRKNYIENIPENSAILNDFNIDD